MRKLYADSPNMTSCLKNITIIPIRGRVLTIYEKIPGLFLVKEYVKNVNT